jgi:hypothetical protein
MEPVASATKQYIRGMGAIAKEESAPEEALRLD